LDWCFWVHFSVRYSSQLQGVCVCVKEREREREEYGSARTL